MSTGWGSIWGGDPWGGGSTPFILTATTLPVGDRTEVFGRLEHVVIGPGGNVDKVPFMDSFAASGVAPGGFESAVGHLPLERVLDQPDIYCPGAVWRTQLAANGDPVFGGVLLDPDISAGIATLTGRGWAFLPQRFAGRVLYQSQFFGDWRDGAGDPFKMATSQHIQVVVNAGSITFTIPDGTAISTGDFQRAVFWAANGGPITRLAFHWAINTGPTGVYQIRKFSFLGPTGTQHVLGANIDLSGAGSGDYDSAVGPDWTQSNLTDDAICFGINRTGGPGTTTGTFVLTITNIRVNGVAVGDTMTSSDIVRDICGRLGIPPAFVQSVPGNALPLDVQYTTLDDPLNYVSVLTDSRWIITDQGYGPTMDFGPWNTRVWVVDRAESPVALQPLDRFNHVLVQFKYTNGNMGFVDVAANPDPLGYPYYFPTHIILLQLPDPTVAQQLGQSIVNYLASLRYGGSLLVSEVTDFFSGARVSGASVLPGDTVILRHYGGAIGRVASTQVTAVGNQLNLDQGLAVYDTLVARRAEIGALRGQVFAGFTGDVSGKQLGEIRSLLGGKGTPLQARPSRLKGRPRA